MSEKVREREGKREGKRERERERERGESGSFDDEEKNPEEPWGKKIIKKFFDKNEMTSLCQFRRL